jgi:hypothetical protein
MASKSEGRKNQRLPSRRPGICPCRAMRLTVFGCSRKKRAASMQFQTGSIALVMFIEIPFLKVGHVEFKRFEMNEEKWESKCRWL